MSDDLKINYLECDCSSAEHTLRFSYFEDEPDMLFIEPHLNTHENIFQRMWAAIKYTLGYKCKYGHFDSVVVNRDKVRELRNQLDTFLRMTQDEKAK